MRSFDAPTLEALRAGRVVLRDFVWIIARNRSTGAAVPDGFWSDAYRYTLNVTDPLTGVVAARTYYPAGLSARVSEINLVSNFAVQTVDIHLAHLVDRVQTLMLTHDIQQAPIQVHRGVFDASTFTLVTLVSLFTGFVNKAPITIPKENEAGDVALSCTSHSQELVRSNPARRSDAYQKLRDPTDNFFQDVENVGKWVFRWGEKEGKVDTKKKGRNGSQDTQNA